MEVQIAMNGNLWKVTDTEHLMMAGKRVLDVGPEFYTWARGEGLEGVVDPNELLKQAAICETAGFWRFLSAEFQAARRLYATLRTHPEPDAEKERMAEGFKKVARWLIDRAAFEKSERHRAALGKAFDGLNTPFEQVARVRAWQRAVHAQATSRRPGLAALARANAQRLRALATLESTRLEAFPQLPTLAESGLKNLNVVNWYGVFAPARTPRDILARWEKELLALPQDATFVATAKGLVVSIGGTRRGAAPSLARVVSTPAARAAAAAKHQALAGRGVAPNKVAAAPVQLKLVRMAVVLLQLQT